MAILADRLLEGLKRRITIPAAQPLLTNDDFFQFSDDVMKTRLIPLLKGVNQDYFVTKFITDVIQNKKYYNIPSRAIGRTLRELKLLDSSGNPMNLALIALEDTQYFVNTGIPRGFYFYGDQIAMVPTPSIPTDSGYQLEIWYELPPGKLISASSAGLVTGFSTTTITVQSLPDTIMTNTVVDFIAGQSGCRTLGMDATVLNASGNTLTFASDVVPEDLQVGDWVSPATYSPVLQIPDEAFPYLETMTAVRVLKAIGDYDAARDLDQSDGKEEEKNLKLILEPRIEGEPTKIINRRGLFRGRYGIYFPGRFNW